MKFGVENRQYFMRELTAEIGMSPAWVIRMEKMGLINPSSPKVRGRTPRLYSYSDVIDLLRLMTFTAVGFEPEKVRDYCTLVQKFNELTLPFLKVPRAPANGSFLSFSPTSIFPLGNPANISWEKIVQEGLWEQVSDILYQIGFHAFILSAAIKRARRVVGLAQSVEYEIDEEFIPALKSLIWSASDFGLGAPAVETASRVKRSFEALDRELKEKRLSGKIAAV
jgi:DNA-binding transcriptional MerR regulator